MELRGATLSDLEALFAFAQNCPGVAAWSAAAWEQTLRSAASSPAERAVLVIMLQQIIVAFGVLHAVADEGEIENLGVSPAFRRQGLGRAVCEGLIAWSRDKGLGRIQLEMRASNVAAQRLYQLLGFQIEGTRRGYYQDPEEDATLMGMAISE